MKGLDIVRELAVRKMKSKYPNMPEMYYPKIKYGDNSANALTKSIVDFIRLNGGYCDRINNTGVYVEGKNIAPGDNNSGLRSKSMLTDGYYRKGTNRKGIADISGVYQGRPLQIEVKHGKDRMSPDQIKVMNEVISAGGLFFIAKDFESFYQWFKQVFNYQFNAA